MKITQIATALNDVINKLDVGAVTTDGVTVTPQVAEDLSNIVDVGKAITKFTGESSDNFDSFIGKLIDQVGKMTFVDRTYTSQAPDIMVDDWTYGSIQMKVRCELPDARDNETWELNKYPIENGDKYPDPFVLSPPDVSAKFFNTKTTYEVPITLCQVQLEQAVRSAADMQRLIAMIENRVQVKRTLCNDGLIMQTITNLMAGIINEASSNRVVDLLGLYNVAKYGDDTTSYINAETARMTPEFLRFATATMMKYKKYLAKASTRYNSGDYVTFTPEDRLRFVVVADFAKDVESNLYSGTYHDEFVRMTGYQEVADWGCSGTDADRFKLYKYLGAGVDGEKINPTLVTADYVVGIMFDEWGAVCANRNDRVTSIYNPRGEYTNFFYKWDAAYLNDWMENAVVFTLGTGTVNLTSIQGTVGAGSAANTTKFELNDGYTLPTGHALKSNLVASKAPAVEPGRAFVDSGDAKYPTGTWSNYTAGSNISSAAADKILTIIEVDGGGIIVGVYRKTLEASDVGTGT